MNKKILMRLGVIIMVMGVWPVATYGGVFVAQEDEAVTNADVNDDLYMAGNSVTVDHQVRDDLFSVANAVEITGAVGQDVFAAGNSVRVTSEVGDDVFAAGNSVRVTPKRADDIFAVGSMVEIVSDNIGGSVYSAGQRITITGQINGSVRVSGENVKIKSGTKIAGDLITYGPNDPVIEGDVSVGGEIKHVLDSAKSARVKAEQGMMIGWIMSVVVWAVTALVLLYLLPILIQDSVHNALQRGGRSLGIGFVWLIALIPVTILLLVTMVGWPLAIVTILASATSLIVANAVSMIVVGVWLMQKLQKKETPITWQQVVVGTVAMRVVQIIPLVGWLIGLAVFMLTLGAVGISLWEHLRGKNHDVNKSVDAVTPS